jgi:hypothetical protein
MGWSPIVLFQLQPWEFWDAWEGWISYNHPETENSGAMTRAELFQLIRDNNLGRRTRKPIGQTGSG